MAPQTDKKCVLMCSFNSLPLFLMRSSGYFFGNAVVHEKEMKTRIRQDVHEDPGF